MIVERQYALENNLTRYMTGKACPKGHISERHTKSTKCVECQKLKKEKSRQRKKELAESTGEVKYSTGVPCSNGHLSERYIRSGLCVECTKQSARQSSEKRRIKLGLPSAEEKRVLAEKKRKALEKKKLSSRLLNKEERRISKYVRSCYELYYYQAVLTTAEYDEQNGSLPGYIRDIENGYTGTELTSHLSSQQPTWRNGKQWHIDHIIPIKQLLLKGVTEVCIINSLDNLQLLSPKRNMNKGSKLRMSNKKFEEWIASKRELYPEQLGLYNPRARYKKLTSEITNQHYELLLNNLKGSDFEVDKLSKADVIKAISIDMHQNWETRLKRCGNTSKTWVHQLCNHQFQENYVDGNIMLLVLKNYLPVKNILNTHRPIMSFKYRNKAEKYFKKLSKSETDKVISCYYDYCFFEVKNSLSKNSRFANIYKQTLELLVVLIIIATLGIIGNL